MTRLREWGKRITRYWPWLLLVGVLLATVVGASWVVSGSSGFQVLFLGWDGTGTTQVYVTDLTGSAPMSLTAVSPQSSQTITEYALSPDEQWIAYLTQPAPDEIGGETIWLMPRERGEARALYSCAPAHCRGLVWHPDNRRLLVEKRPLEKDDLPGQPRLHWVDSVSGETALLLPGEEATGMAARFSPDGNWIGYLTSDQEGVQIYNFEDGRHFLARSLTGMPPVWHPARPLLLISDFNRLESTGVEETALEPAAPDSHSVMAVHLYRVDVIAQVRQLLSQSLLVEDGAPAWSPDGSQIAFGRRPPRTAAGRQLWLMDATGENARPLTHEPLVNYGPPVWSGDGRFLLSQRFDLGDPEADPAIWLIESVTGEGRQLAANGIFPTWVDNK